MTSRTSLLVYLVVIERSETRDVARGWFDGITLEVGAAEDAMFRDSFE